MVNTVIQTDLLVNCIKHEFPHQNSTYRKFTIADEGQKTLYRITAFEQGGYFYGLPLC